MSVVALRSRLLALQLASPPANYGSALWGARDELRVFGVRVRRGYVQIGSDADRARHAYRREIALVEQQLLRAFPPIASAMHRACVSLGVSAVSASRAFRRIAEEFAKLERHDA